MKLEDTVDRRTFTMQSALALLSGVTITILGCGSDSPSSPSGSTTTTAPAATPPPSDVTGVVGSNHGHRAVIEAARLTAGDELELDITGSADHPHTVRLTSQDLQQIAAGSRVARTSSVDFAHAHTVTFN